MEQRISRLILTVSLLFLATALGLATLTLWRAYADAVSRAEVQAATAAHAVAAHATWLLEASSQTLMRIEDAAQSRDPDMALKRIVAELPAGFALTLHDQDGQTIIPGRVNDISSEAIVISLEEDLADDHLSVSRFLPDTPGGGFFVARRITAGMADDWLAAVQIPSDLLSDFWRSLDLGPASAISIVRRDGWIVARHPVPEGFLDLSQHLLFTDLLRSAESDTYHSPASPADGVARIVAYKAVPDLPLVAIAAISRSQALSPYWERLQQALLMGTPLLLLLAGLAWWQALLLRRAERIREQIAESAEHNRLLLREVHHRVKNNLQIILSMIRMQNLPPDSELDLSNRVMAMATLHEHLHGSGPAGLIELGSYLREIFEGVNASYDTGMKLKLQLEDGIHAVADIATPLGLIANELVTNANKYAYPHGSPGTMTVTLAQRPDKGAALSIRNDGIPFDAAPGSKGEGIRLIRSLAVQVDPNYTFSGQEGLEFALVIPTGFPDQQTRNSRS